MAKNKIQKFKEGTGFGSNQIGGIVLIGLSFLLLKFIPKTECSWWNIFCHAGNQAVDSSFKIIVIIIMAIGIWFLLNKPLKGVLG